MEVNQPEKTATPTRVVPPGWLRPLSWNELLSLPEPKTRWIIRGMVPVESLVLLSGPRKRSYKTYLAMLASALAMNGAACRGFDRWVAEEAVNVLFLEQESTQHDNRRRMRNIREGQGWSPEGPFKKDFHWALRSNFKLDNPRMVTDLIKYVKDEGIKLVVLDALTFMQQGDPNSTRDAAVIASSLQLIRNETGTSVLFIMHTGKEGEAIDRDPDLDVRNSSVMLDVYDAHIAIRRKKKRVLTTTMRFRENPEYEVEMFWHLPPMGANDEPAIGPAWVQVIEAGQEKQTTDVTSRLIEAGWIRGQIYTIQAFREALGCAPAKAAEMRATLISDGKLIAAQNGTGVGLPLILTEGGKK